MENPSIRDARERFKKMKKLEHKKIEDMTPEEYELMYPDLSDVDWDEYKRKPK